ncbi:16S rRNA (adenine(1518)-N(6)/adenine(1519)-N(6))-dimethyltransferase RsmA [Leptospira sp. 96542]|nr:16S rRNA (adenine(1518)-N(6)/adenine(1519)-N(6))-dimethyltransferase RsmA [Leptospira sp. 96542]
MKSPYSTKTEIQRFFDSKQISAQKKFGQNFLIDQNIVQFIAGKAKDFADSKDICFAEIGIGLGTITYPILDLKKTTHLFEIDRAYIKLAEEEILPKYSNAKLHEGDALKNLHILFQLPVFVFGNLPYHLTTEILNQLVIGCKQWFGGIFMVQKEFAERLVKENSSLSIFLSGFGSVKILKTVHKNCFFPIPKIHSSLIQFTPHPKPELLFQSENDLEIWSTLLRTLFWGKRKQIQVSVRESPFSKDLKFQSALLSAMEISGLDPKRRPEELNREQFLNLGQHLLDILSK